MLEKESDPQIWQNRTLAQEVGKKKRIITDQLESYDVLISRFSDAKELAHMEDPELDEQIAVELKSLDALANKFEVECLLSGENDQNNCFIDINSGAGGTESDDWASVMMRMYLRFAERLKYKSEIIDLLEGEEAGIKSCTIKITGHNSYGWFKTESGVHRLVRISPYNAAGKRMTSFASAWVYPEISENSDVEIIEKDLKIDTYRASGAGGQHVNTTDSAVRITHLPTNIVVQCQSQRSQHKNKAEALSMLRAKLFQKELEKRQEQANVQNSSKTDIGWGHQIRSYVLHPYQMVKDHRTDFSTTDSEKLLDGALENFVKASLAQKVTNVR